jgi:cobalt-precorrin-5B (C1)-methyltransferase
MSCLGGFDSRLVAGRLLRRGRTTGACAADAAKAAAELLLAGDLEYAEASVTKDSGDDPDITNGCTVRAKATRAAEGIAIIGGEGIGRVTKPGLDQPVGEYAINTVPRRMIKEACEAVCKERGYGGGLAVEISIPGGEELARRTFNPRMGIVGGLSILGTTGIVEPMSEAAVADTIRAELSLLYEAGSRDVALTIGNYGEAFARECLKLELKPHVKCGNFIGETLSAAAEKGFQKATLIGHIGKLVKLGIGVTNTHSSHGDGRIETLVALALEAGASLETLRKIRECVSTDAALDCLEEAALLDETMRLLQNRIQDTLNRHIGGRLEIKVICYRGLGEGMAEVFRI